MSSEEVFNHDQSSKSPEGSLLQHRYYSIYAVSYPCVCVVSMLHLLIVNYFCILKLQLRPHPIHLRSRSSLLFYGNF